MYHAYVSTGDALREDPFCESYHRLYEYILVHLPELLRRLRGLPAHPAMESLAQLLDLENGNKQSATASSANSFSNTTSIVGANHG
jgi:hypothetical protein